MKNEPVFPEKLVDAAIMAALEGKADFTRFHAPMEVRIAAFDNLPPTAPNLTSYTAGQVLAITVPQLRERISEPEQAYKMGRRVGYSIAFEILAQSSPWTHDYIKKLLDEKFKVNLNPLENL